MIASLHGKVTQTGANFIVLEVAGVGFLVNVVPQLSASMTLGQDVNLFTRLVVREDAMTLFGFESSEECDAFDLLTSVSGVGPKLGLSIIASLPLENIASAVMNELDAVFRSVPGIGAKTAKLITVTLAGRFGGSTSRGSADVVEALIGLGYSQKAESGAVAKIGSVQNKSSALKLALAHLSGSETTDRS